MLKEELAWILLNFNQKRGYYQLRGEEEKKNDNVMIINSKVIDVVKAEKDKKYLDRGSFVSVDLGCVLNEFVSGLFLYLIENLFICCILLIRVKINTKAQYEQ